jgi:hypothetical protein
MTSHPRKTLARYLQLHRLVLRGGQRGYGAVAIFLAVSPPLIAALFATGPERWELFERSGALTTTIGLLLASRRYLQRGIIEIAMIDAGHGSESNMTDLLEDVHATKLGLAISAFGTIIWGLGKYLRWWTFSSLIVWAAITALDAWRDLVCLRDNPSAVPSAEQGTNQQSCSRAAG